MAQRTITLGNGRVTGHSIHLGNAPLLLIQAKKGYVMCGYLNMTAANTLGDIAGRVTAVRTIQEMLNATVSDVSEKATHLGLKQGMPVREFLEALL